MSLIITAQKIAAEIDGINSETLGFLQSQARRVYALANTPGQEQAILDAFGNQAVAALTTYGAIYGALAALGQSDGLASPDLAVFQPQPDGTVKFVPPVEPEP